GIRSAGSPPGGGRPPGTGHVIQNNRLAQNRSVGIEVVGFGSVIRGNIVANTGDRPLGGIGWGIRALGGVDVIDNVVDGIFDDGVVTAFQSVGIFISDFGRLNTDITPSGMRIVGNRVRNLAQKGGANSLGIYLAGTGIWVSRQPDRTTTPYCWRGRVVRGRRAGPRQRYQELLARRWPCVQRRW